MRFLLAPILLAACGSGPTQTTLRDQGSACVDLEAETITVDFGTCLSSSCDTLLEASCTATWNNDTVVVQSNAVIESAGPGSDCTDDCGLVTASCALPADATPEGTLAYAGLTRPIDKSGCEDGLP